MIDLILITIPIITNMAPIIIKGTQLSILPTLVAPILKERILPS
jgi:hypothetical protein